MLIYNIFPSGLIDKFVTLCVKTKCMASTSIYIKEERCHKICTKVWSDHVPENDFSTVPIAHALLEPHWWHVSLYFPPFSDVAGNSIMWFYQNKFFNGRFASPHKVLIQLFILQFSIFFMSLSLLLRYWISWDILSLLCLLSQWRHF